MSYYREERRRLKQERKLARRAARVPVDVALPISGLSGAELETQLRRRAELRLRRRTEFYKSLATYILVNVLVWTIWAVTMFGGFPWPIFVTLGWGIGIVPEWIMLYQDSQGTADRNEDRIQREIELERARLGLASDPYDKPKRGQAMRLSDDGELIPADDEEDMEQDAKVKRS